MEGLANYGSSFAQDLSAGADEKTREEVVKSMVTGTTKAAVKPLEAAKTVVAFQSEVEEHCLD